MYVCVRVYSIFDIFSPAVWIFVSTFQRALSFSRFRSLTVQRYSIKKRKTPYVGGTRRGYGLI